MIWVRCLLMVDQELSWFVEQFFTIYMYMHCYVCYTQSYHGIDTNQNNGNSGWNTYFN